MNTIQRINKLLENPDIAGHPTALLCEQLMGNTENHPAILLDLNKLLNSKSNAVNQAALSIKNTVEQWNGEWLFSTLTIHPKHRWKSLDISQYQQTQAKMTKHYLKKWHDHLSKKFLTRLQYNKGKRLGVIAEIGAGEDNTNYHIHALIEQPNNISRDEFIANVSELWSYGGSVTERYDDNLINVARYIEKSKKEVEHLGIDLSYQR